MTTNTPPRLNRSASSVARSSPDSTVSAAASARSRASSSIPESRAPRKSKKSASPNARRTAPMTRALKTVRRHRIGKTRPFPQGPSQGVADPPYGLDKPDLARGVELLAQVPDVDVHHVGLDA